MTGKSKIAGKVGPFRVIGGFLAVLAALIAVSAAIVNYSFRIGYVFIDHEVFDGFSELLFYVMIANAVYNVGVAAATLAKKRIPIPIFFVSFISLILSVFFWAVNYVSSDIAHFETAYIIIGAAAPFLAALFGVPFLLLCFPNLKISAKARNITAVVLSVIFVGAIGAAAIFKIPPISFEFEAMPIVLDIGTGEYSVVFATNADAQGYVTYKYQGEEKTVYANEAGYKSIGRIHAVKIPREELDGNQYTAHATRVLERLSYGGKLGKTIDTKTYTLKDTTNAVNPKILSASDWHNELSLLEKAAANVKDEPDLVILLGDFADFFVNEWQIAKYFIGGAHILTGGEIPSIFVRGNHEVRGNEKVEDIGLKLGLTNMYYQVRRGNNLFTVFDTAENEDGDQWEHDGFYDMIPYFTEQVEWFESLPTPDPSVNSIILMHDWEFTTRQDEAHTEVRDRFTVRANAFNVDFSVSGHSHNWRLNEPGANGFDFYHFQDGGRNGGNAAKTLADVGFLRDVELSSALRKILQLVVLEKHAQTYRLSFIIVEDNTLTFQGITSENAFNAQTVSR